MIPTVFGPGAGRRSDQPREEAAGSGVGSLKQRMYPSTSSTQKSVQA
jgi:hypothetical protein